MVLLRFIRRFYPTAVNIENLKVLDAITNSRGRFEMMMVLAIYGVILKSNKLPVCLGSGRDH